MTSSLSIGRRRLLAATNKRMTEKEKVSKVDAVDVARPILSALSKKMHINKDTYKDVLRATVRCLFLYSSFCSFYFFIFLKLEWMLDDLGRELSA